MDGAALPRELLAQVCRHLPPRALLRLSAASACAAWAADQQALRVLGDRADGARLLAEAAEQPGRRRRRAPRQGERLARALPPCVRLDKAMSGASILRGYKASWHEQARLMPFDLDAEGPWFVEFSARAARAPNGRPTLGLLGPAPPGAAERWRDLSRRPSSEVEFGMSFCPASARVFAALGPGGAGRLCGGEEPDPAEACKSRCFTARLCWPAIDGTEERRKTNEVVRAGLFVEGGRLSLCRATCGMWQSSGVIMEGLPSRVVPSVFTFAFSGYADIRLTGIGREMPPVCPGCRESSRGVVAWRPWPLRQQ